MRVGVVVFLLSLVTVSATEARAAKVHTSFEAAQAAASEAGQPLFVHFTADWCKACKEMRADVYPLKPVADRLARFTRVEVDIKSPEGALVARKYATQSLPVLAFMRANGEELIDFRLVGKQAPGDLIRELDAAAAALGLPPFGEQAAEPAPKAEPALQPESAQTPTQPPAPAEASKGGGAPWAIIGGAVAGLVAAIFVIRKRKA